MAANRTNRQTQTVPRDTYEIAFRLARLLDLELGEQPVGCQQLPTAVGNKSAFEEPILSSEIEDYRIYHIVINMLDATHIGLQDGDSILWMVNANNEIIYVFWSYGIAIKTYNQFCRILGQYHLLFGNIVL